MVTSFSKLFSSAEIYKTISYMIFAVVVFLVTPVMAGSVIFEDTFENDPVGQPPNSDFKRKLDNWGSCSGNCTEITSEESRRGKKSLKTYLHRNKSKVSYRTEAVPRGEARDQAEKGKDYWYGFSTLIPNTHLPDTLGGDTIAQWHSRTGHPVTLRLDGTNLHLIVRDENRNKSKSYNLGQYAPGNWTDWVFHIVWSINNDGILELWKDGKKVVTHSGANAKNEPGAPWLKIGLYKTVWRNDDHAGIRFDPNVVSRTLYHDEVRIASGRTASYSDVDPSQSGGGGEDKLSPPSNLRIISSN